MFQYTIKYRDSDGSIECAQLAEIRKITSEVWVCENCYQAHHYGAGGEEWDMRTWEENSSGREFTDWTCSDHNGTDYAECDYCGAQNWETGIEEFSKGSCDLCGSHLAGYRFRLAEWGQS